MSLWKIIASGDVIGAVKKVIALAEGEITALETEFPVLGEFISQFDSDFGKAALADGVAFVNDIRAGTVTLPSAATTLLSQLESQALDTAGHDALTVASNALGVLVRVPAPPVAAAAAV